MSPNPYFKAPIAHQIWDAKYRFKDSDGNPIDHTVQDTWSRIAKALASAESLDFMDRNRPYTYREHWEDKFYKALEDFKFLPAGRITAGAGTDRSVTLFNCFVMGTVPDSIAGIFDMLKEAALTMQQGGGIGYDFSTIRPAGAHVKGVAADASGPLSFMDCWDGMCRTIMSAGSRRGAMMATLRCDHPDIFKYITAKKDPLKLRMFNLSVLITDEFMEVLEADGDWDLIFNGKVYETVKASEVWDAIMTSTYNQAEPGVIFIDRINKMNNLWYIETIASTNPCGEQPLPPYGACLLGSINLVKFIKDPFTNDSQIDWELLEQTVSTAIRMMDNVIDVSNFPLEAQKVEAKAKRRIGLGVTGLADALIMMGLTYGSDDALTLTDEIMLCINNAAYATSALLAKEKGAFPLFDKEQFLKSGFMKKQSPGVRDFISEHGLRNALVTSIAPTGTISLYAGNVSSGIEPVFAYEYTRKVLEKDGTKREEVVRDYAAELYVEHMAAKGVEVFEYPDYFVSAQTLPPEAHVRMQAAAQRWVDSSISKTINLPEDISYDDFKKVYLHAWNTGCKGCTTYRPNDITGSVLSVEPKKEKPLTIDQIVDKLDPVLSKKLTVREKSLKGMTYKIKFGGDQHAIYVTLNYSCEPDGNKPYEIFINSKNMDHFVWTVGLTRMISAVFRISDDSTFVLEELKSVFDPKGGAWMDGKYVPSVLAAIGNVIEQFMQEIGYVAYPDLVPDPMGDYEISEPRDTAHLCPNCFGSDFKMESGCETCLSCGHSKCG